MAWDDTKADGDDFTADEHNNQVADQKNHSQRHEADGSDEISLAGLPGVAAHGADYSVKQITRSSGDYRATDRDGELVAEDPDMGVIMDAIHTDVVDSGMDDGPSVQLSGGYFFFGQSSDWTHGLDLRGRGRNRTYVDGSSDYFLSLGGSDAFINELRGIKFVGQGGAAEGIRITDAAEFNAMFCEWRDFSRAGIRWNKPNDEIWSELTGCWALQCGDGHSEGGAIVIDNSDGGSINELNINGGYFDSADSTYGPAIRSLTTAGLSNLTLSGATIKGHTPIHLGHIEDSSISGNTIRNISGAPAINFYWDAHGSAFDASTRIVDNTFVSNESNVPPYHIEVGNNWQGVTLSNTHRGSVDNQYVVESFNNRVVRRGNDPSSVDYASSPPASPQDGDTYLDDGSNTSTGTRGKLVHDGSGWTEVWTV